MSPFSAIKRAEGAAAPRRAALKWEIKGGGRARLPAETPAQRPWAPRGGNGGPAGAPGDGGSGTARSGGAQRAGVRRPERAEPSRPVPRAGTRLLSALGESAHVAPLPGRPHPRHPPSSFRGGDEKPHIWPQPQVSALAPPCQRGRGWSRGQALRF